MSRFWKVYATVNDDVRHELVEKAWFGKEVTPNIDAGDIPAIADTVEVGERVQEINDFYGRARQAEPDPTDLYGQPSVAPPENHTEDLAPEV
jgi:hypothetical protein